MKKGLCAVLVLVLCLTGTIHVYAAGPQEPTIESQMPDCYVVLGEHILTLYTDATSPDGGTLEYQWYSTTVNDIATIRAIDGQTGGSFTPPQTVGVMYYCYAVWNVKSGIRSAPVYSRLIRVEYAEAEPVVTGIEILSTPDKVVYTSGECLDLTGLRVRIWMSDGYIDSVNGDKLEITKNPLITLGEQKIKVTYQGVSDFFIVTVKAAEHTHSFGEWMILTEPTCTESGIKARECDCGHTERAEVPATGHRWDEGTVTKEPTSDSEGERTYTCTVCRKTETEVIEAVAAPSEPSEASDPSKPGKNLGLGGKGDRTGSGETTEPGEETEPTEKRGSTNRRQPSETEPEQSPGFPWWIIAAIAAAAVTGGILGSVLTRKKKK